MTLVLTEAETAGLLRMGDVLPRVEAALRALGAGEGENIPRRRPRAGQARLNNMSAGLAAAGTLGLKAYCSVGGGSQMVVLLWDMHTGVLLAMLGANHLGATRTGAASGVATQYLAVSDARVLGVIGTGSQARTQVEAICLVRPITRVQVYGRNPERQRVFCDEMARVTGAEVVPVDSGEAAVRGAQVVTVITNAAEPVLRGAWLEPGMHVNAAGSNQATRRELDVAAVQRATRVFADQVETAKLESGDLIAAVEAGAIRWDDVRGIGEVVAGKVVGRERPDDVTLFESQGLAIEDVATATAIYHAAQAAGIGRELALV